MNPKMTMLDIRRSIRNIPMTRTKKKYVRFRLRKREVKLDDSFRLSLSLVARRKAVGLGDNPFKWILTRWQGTCTSCYQLKLLLRWVWKRTSHLRSIFTFLSTLSIFLPHSFFSSFFPSFSSIINQNELLLHDQNVHRQWFVLSDISASSRQIVCDWSETWEWKINA